MTSNKQIVGLLKAIYFIAIAIALMVIAYMVSGGQNNNVSNVLFVAGIIMFFIGLFKGLIHFPSSKGDGKVQ